MYEYLVSKESQEQIYNNDASWNKRLWKICQNVELERTCLSGCKVGEGFASFGTANAIGSKLGVSGRLVGMALDGSE